VPRRAIGAADSHPLSARRFAPVHQAAEADVIRPKQACGSCRRLSAAPLCGIGCHAAFVPQRPVSAISWHWESDFTCRKPAIRSSIWGTLVQNIAPNFEEWSYA
jgi:hypothetical protein